MAVIACIEKPRVIKKLVTVFNLANNYHSVVGSDIQDDIKQLMLEEIILNFNKHLFIYCKNGHKKYNSLDQIQNIDNAFEFAQCSFIKAWCH